MLNNNNNNNRNQQQNKHKNKHTKSTVHSLLLPRARLHPPFQTSPQCTHNTPTPPQTQFQYEMAPPPPHHQPTTFTPTVVLDARVNIHSQCWGPPEMAQQKKNIINTTPLTHQHPPEPPLSSSSPPPSSSSSSLSLSLYLFLSLHSPASHTPVEGR